ncbi:MAG: tetratricopeptide repeat protein [Blastocatellia bacterium]
MKYEVRKLILPALCICAGFVLLLFISNFLEGNRIELPDDYEDSDLALQGKRLKGYALGAEGLLADWYWMQSLQYLGKKIEKSDSDFINVEDLRSLKPGLLYPYLDNATDLDPHFMAAYSYGAIVLPAIDSEKAIQFTEKGIANNPEQWRLYQYLGYIYWRLKDYKKAAEVYERGSRIKDAAPFMKMMAATMINRGGSRETARSMYQQMLDESQDQQARKTAELRLMELDFFDERDAINAALKTSAAAKGQCPQNLREIIPVLQSVKLPNGGSFHLDAAGNLADPSGAPYLLNREKCEISLDKKLTKLPKQ